MGAGLDHLLATEREQLAREARRPLAGFHHLFRGLETLLRREIARLERLRGINTGDLYTWSGRYRALARDFGRTVILSVAVEPSGRAAKLK